MDIYVVILYLCGLLEVQTFLPTLFSGNFLENFLEKDEKIIILEVDLVVLAPTSQSFKFNFAKIMYAKQVERLLLQSRHSLLN